VAFKPSTVGKLKQGRMNPTSREHVSYIGSAFGVICCGVAFKPPAVSKLKQDQMNLRSQGYASHEDSYFE